MIEITEKPIEVWNVLQSVLSEKAGGVVHFIGTVRREKDLKGLLYECYPEMALKVLKTIVDEAKIKCPLEGVSVVHRYGWVEVGEPSVVIAVSSEHRKEAFEACRFVIDRIKEKVPIWKTRNPSQPPLTLRGGVPGAPPLKVRGGRGAL